MSSTGALVEAVVLPAADTPVRVVRGSLAAAGTIAWVKAGRCGVRFDSPVAVRDWMAPSRNTEQHRVDATVALLRGGARVPASSQAINRTSDESLAALQLATDLRGAASLLDQLSGDLAGDAHVVRQHALSLQGLDIAAQTLAAVIANLTAQTCEAAGQPDRLQSLRKSRDSLTR